MKKLLLYFIILFCTEGIAKDKPHDYSPDCVSVGIENISLSNLSVDFSAESHCGLNYKNPNYLHIKQKKYFLVKKNIIMTIFDKANDLRKTHLSPKQSGQVQCKDDGKGIVCAYK